MVDTLPDTRQGQQIYFFAKTPKLAMEPTHPPNEWVQLGAAIVSKQREREVDTRPSGAEVKNERRCTSAALMPSQPGQGQPYLLPLPRCTLFTIKLLKMQTYTGAHIE